MQTKTVEYSCDGKIFEGFLAYEKDEKRPLVMVFPAWRGRDDFACNKAKELAKLGYVGFAVDLYGKGIVAKDDEESERLMQPLVKDRKLLQSRLQASFEAAKNQKQVDSKRIGAIGFCFGGLCALDLGRSGADVKAIVSFHGLLNAPKGLPQKKIQAKILALHGSLDPMVSPHDMQAFQEEMTKAEIDWQVHVYGHAMHAFTNPVAKDPGSGKLYNSLADHRSWKEMKDFFAEALS